MIDQSHKCVRTISKLVNTCESWKRSRWNDSNAGPEQCVPQQRRPCQAAAADWCVFVTDDRAYARWQKLDLNSCRHESAGALVAEKSSPRWISSSSCLLQPLPGIPRTKPSTFLPPSALSSSSFWTSISSPLSHSLRLHEQPLLILMSLNVTSSLTVSVLLAGSPQICVCGVLSKTTVLSLHKHLEQTESGLTLSWCFWWIRLCRLARGPVWSEKCCWFESHQGWSEARLRCRWNIAKVCRQRRCVLVKWAKSEGRPHMQMLLCVVCCWFPLCWAVNSLKRLRYESGDQWSGLCLLHDGRINAEEEETSVWCLNEPQRLTNN